MFIRLSWSGLSRPSRLPSPSLSARRGEVPGPEFEGGPQAVAVGVLATVTDAVAVGVGAARMHPGDVFLPVRQAVAVGVLASVGEAVAVRVGAGRAGQRVGRSQVLGRPSWSVSVAAVAAAGVSRPATSRTAGSASRA